TRLAQASRPDQRADQGGLRIDYGGPDEGAPERSFGPSHQHLPPCASGVGRINENGRFDHRGTSLPAYARGSRESLQRQLHDVFYGRMKRLDSSVDGAGNTSDDNPHTELQRFDAS